MSNSYSIDPKFLNKLNAILKTIDPFKLKLGGPVYRGRASKLPWSGHWWPYYDSAYGDNLYDVGGPLEKYDKYVKKVSGQTSNAVQLEKSIDCLNPHYRPLPKCTQPCIQHPWHSWYTGADDNWSGHCDGLAAAAVSEPEPKNPKTKQGITFTVGDQKGLLTEGHTNCPYEIYQPLIGKTLPAHVFHKILIDWLGTAKKAVIIDASCDQPPNYRRTVDNHPIAAYEMQYETDAADPSKTHVICMVWGSNYAPKDFVGTDKKPLECWPDPYGKTYYYWITGDISDPNNGGWEKGSETDHPDFIWHPSIITSNNIVQQKWVKEIVS